MAEFHDDDELTCRDDNCKGSEETFLVHGGTPELCPFCKDSLFLLCPFCGVIVEDTDMRVCCGEMF